MSDSPDPTIVREIAREVMQQAASRLPYYPEGVSGALVAHGIDGRDMERWAPYGNAVRKYIKTATVTVSWPDEQPQDERDAEIAKLRADLAEMTGCRNAAMAYADRQHVPIELDDEIDIDGEELASRIEGELLGPGWDWEDDRTPGLLAKQAVAVIRPHLARLTDQAQKAREAAQAEQPQDDGDVRGTCAHCRRDLTGASVYTIQGIDVCADIRHCLARQARFVERIVELDQAKAQHQAAQDERDGDVRAVAAFLQWFRGDPDDYAIESIGDQLLTVGTLRRMVAALDAMRPEYGIRADFTDTTSAEFTVAETLDEALEALAEFDAKYAGKVLSRELTVRPVGEPRKVGQL